jgi:hypothetical protein
VKRVAEIAGGRACLKPSQLIFTLSPKDFGAPITYVRHDIIVAKSQFDRAPFDRNTRPTT